MNLIQTIKNDKILNIISEEFEAYSFGINSLEETIEKVVSRSNEAIEAEQTK